MSGDVIVFKIGGSVAEVADLTGTISSLFDEIGHDVVLVHGGGALVGEWAAKLGLETKFIRGLRVTDEPTRDLAVALLGGLANTRIVAKLLAWGVPAVGLTGVDGGMLRAQREDSALGLVGNIRRVDSALLEQLIEMGRVPVVAPAALEEPMPVGEVEVLNVNADGAAGAIAAALGARLLIFVTDVPGVRGRDGKVLSRLDRERAKALMDDGTIEGGMLPKIEACLVASGAGCRAAIVGPADVSTENVERLLAGDGVGTVFEPAVAVR